jgi:Fic family protein
MNIETIFSEKNILLFSYQNEKIQSAQNQLTLIPDQKRALFIAEKNRVDFVYNTAALEGNPFTFPEIKTLLDGITVGGHKISDSEQVLNLNRALTYLIRRVKERTFHIDPEVACSLQGIIAREEALTWGVFRDAMVSISGTDYRPPEAKRLNEIFTRGAIALKSVEDPILRAFLVFLWGSLNQFFYDGNKRTSRFLSNGTLLCAGFPPLMISAKDQLTYNQVMTRFYDTQDATEALIWLYTYYYEQIKGFGFDK